MKKHWHIMLASLSGILFLLWLSSCARLAYDDYLFSACFKHHSFFEAIRILSNTHTFRWTTFLLQDLVFGVVPGQYFPASIFVFSLLLYALWIWQLHKLVRTTAKKFLSVQIDRGLSLSIAALFVSALYFAASQAVENFTFSGAVCDRLVPLLFTTMALNIVSKPEHGWAIYIKLGALAFLIAGTAENSTITLLIVMGVYALYKWIIQKEKITTALLFFAVELLVFLAMELLSPGSDARYEAEKVYHFTCGDDNAYCADSLGLFLTRFFHWRQLFVLPILALFFLMGNGFLAPAKAAAVKLIGSGIWILLAGLILTIVFHVVSSHWVFGCYGPMRIWLPVNILLVLLGICVAIYLGSRTSPRRELFSVATGVLVALLIAIYFSRHYRATTDYASAYDNRVSDLVSRQAGEDVVEVDALPPADLVVEGDIMTDENDDVNHDFVDTYRLSFKVRRKK